MYLEKCIPQIIHIHFGTSSQHVPNLLTLPALLINHHENHHPMISPSTGMTAKMDAQIPHAIMSTSAAGGSTFSDSL